MFVKVLRAFLTFTAFFVLLLGPLSEAFARKVDHTDDVASKVICNVVVFVQKLGLPIMTGVILGSSVMAVFGRLAWPAIVVLVVFTAIFFGSSKLIAKFASGIAELGAEDFDCRVIAGAS